MLSIIQEKKKRTLLKEKKIRKPPYYCCQMWVYGPAAFAPEFFGNVWSLLFHEQHEGIWRFLDVDLRVLITVTAFQWETQHCISIRKLQLVLTNVPDLLLIVLLNLVQLLSIPSHRHVNSISEKTKNLVISVNVIVLRYSQPPHKMHLLVLSAG